MKIIDETGIVLTAEPDLEAGYLVEDVQIIHHDAVEGTAPQWHRETAKLPDGSLAIYYRDGKEIGRDMVKVIDVPGVDPQPACAGHAVHPLHRRRAGPAGKGEAGSSTATGCAGQVARNTGRPASRPGRCGCAER